MAEFELIADGLRFPEGPVVMGDGSVIVVEVEAGCITRCWPGGHREVIATPGDGPNGLAFGPDGKLYCANNGGLGFAKVEGGTMPHGMAAGYAGGRIERIDIQTGQVEVLYRSGDHGVILRGPNDLVFDDQGGFWISDWGKTDIAARRTDIVGIFYAKADGSLIEEVIFPSNNPNGIGLSPDGKALYAAESHTCRLMKFNVVSPGKIGEEASLGGLGIPLYRPSGYKFFDSLAVEASGNVCIATVGESGISVVSPEGKLVEFIVTDDPYTTNIAFGGRDGRDAYITLSSSGRLVKTRWARPGLPLHYGDGCWDG